MKLCYLQACEHFNPYSMTLCKDCESLALKVSSNDRFSENHEKRAYQQWEEKAEKGVDDAWWINR